MKKENGFIPRRQAREWALQFLVQQDLNPSDASDETLAAFWEQVAECERERLADDERGARALVSSDKERIRRDFEQEARPFAEARMRGVMATRDALDAILTPCLKNWSLYRLGTIERNVLRLGAWELENCPDIPPPIVVNEAVDLAKYFSETKSGRFVNAVLDALVHARGKSRAGGENR